MTMWLTDYGFIVSDADPSLCLLERNIDEVGQTVRLNVHVDDAFAVYTHS
jgi:hypothetical protein